MENLLLQEKFENLKNDLSQLKSVAVAFSSGVDSTFLLKVAHDVLGDKAIAVTINQQSFPERELNESIEFCKQENITHIIKKMNELSIEGFSKNPKNRCYLCKKGVFSEIWNVAHELSIENVCEGSNIDDEGDYRPGLIAIQELRVKSPLRKANLSKIEIRELSKKLNLPTAEKPSFACLSSRFAYGEDINEKKLLMVEKSEDFLHNLGFLQLRVRIHGDNIARIEVSPKDFEQIILQRTQISKALKKIGFSYVSLDLEGYRTGAMNEVL